MNRILDAIYSEERRVGKYYCSASSYFLEAHPSLVEATMKIDKPVSKQAFRGGWGIQFNASKDRAELVELITFLFDESRKAQHVYKQNERRLEWFCHLMLNRSAFKPSTAHHAVLARS